MAQPAVLVTGGLGYIGSHTTVSLAAAGYRPVIVDNLGNAKASVLERLRALAGDAGIAFRRADVRDQAAIADLLRQEQVQAVVHFAYGLTGRSTCSSVNGSRSGSP